jgi:hypothetical protein
MSELTFAVEKIPIIVTLKCDICGEMNGTGWKRGSVKIHRNGIIRYAPMHRRWNLCEKHFYTFEPYSIHVEYDQCDEETKRFWDRD